MFWLTIVASNVNLQASHTHTNTHMSHNLPTLTHSLACAHTLIHTQFCYSSSALPTSFPSIFMPLRALLHCYDWKQLHCAYFAPKSIPCFSSYLPFTQDSPCYALDFTNCVFLLLLCCGWPKFLCSFSYWS